MKKKEIQYLILGALEVSEFKWRTARGVAKDTNIPIQMVKEFLENSPATLRSKIPNKFGKLLYTTRNKYRRRTPLTKRLLAVLKNESN